MRSSFKIKQKQFVHDGSMSTNTKQGWSNDWSDLAKEQLPKLKRQLKCKRELGSGMYAKVFATTDKNKVIKIGYFYGDYKVSTLPYLTFLKETSKYPSNPFFPKVYDVEVINAVDKSTKKKEPLLFVVTMERLTENNQYGEDDIDDVFVTGYGQVEQEMVKEQKRKLNLLGIKMSKKQERIYTQVLKVLNCGKFDVNDLHDGNVMMRGNQLVITDPTC